MKGQKLFSLVTELTPSQSKALLFFCQNRRDKRYKIFSSLIRNKKLSYEDFMERFHSLCRKNYPEINAESLSHKMRRLSSFFCELIENQIFESLPDKKIFTDFLLSKHFEKTGNSWLREQYLEQTYRKQLDSENQYLLLETIPALVSLNFQKSSKSSFSKGLLLNETCFKIAKTNYDRAVLNYYNTLTSVFFENHLLIKKPVETLTLEIENLIRNTDNSELILGYRISQLRLSFGSKNLDYYFSEAEKLVNLLVKGEEQPRLVRSYFFLKQILDFFAGVDPIHLIETSLFIRSINKQLSILDHFTVFYLSILYIISGQPESYKKLIEEEKHYFRQENFFLEEFLDALFNFNNGKLAKAQKTLVKLQYIEDYFINQFSRVLLAGIYALENEFELLHSLIRSSQRQIHLHPEKFLVNESSLKFFRDCYQKFLKNKITHPNTSDCKGSILHEFVRKRIFLV